MVAFNKSKLLCSIPVSRRRIDQLTKQNRLYRKVFARANIPYPYNHVKSSQWNNYKIPKLSESSSNRSTPTQEYQPVSILDSDTCLPQLKYPSPTVSGRLHWNSLPSPSFANCSQPKDGGHNGETSSSDQASFGEDDGYESCWNKETAGFQLNSQSLVAKPIGSNPFSKNLAKGNQHVPENGYCGIENPTALTKRNGFVYPALFKDASTQPCGYIGEYSLDDKDVLVIGLSQEEAIEVASWDQLLQHRSILNTSFKFKERWGGSCVW